MHMASLQLQHLWLTSFTKKPTALFPSSSKPSPFKLSFSLNPSNSAEPSKPSSPNPPEVAPGEAESPPVDPVKLAFEKAKAYKKSVETSKSLKLDQNPVQNSGAASNGSGGKDMEVPDSVKAAMEKAKEYKKNEGVVGGGLDGMAQNQASSGVKGGDAGNIESGLADKSSSKTEKLSISSIDFMGLNFADKKSSKGLPPGLLPVTDPFPGGDLQEVEIIVGDTSEFGDTRTSMPLPPQEESPDLYKPKVSTWGVFPRPGNISKTFGGGRTIRPGDAIETNEERAAKDERTRKLLAAYKKKVGITIDAKLKSESEKALKDGDFLMDSGKLNEALSYYEMVINKLPFQSELHGLAALQWSICQDSLRRPDEARTMYEKLQSHPNVQVSKKAKQFMFSFQAMEMMKVTGSNFAIENPGYQNYFEAFIEDKSNFSSGEAETEEGELSQVLPYIMFLVSPILIVFFIAVQGRNVN